MRLARALSTIRAGGARAGSSSENETSKLISLKTLIINELEQTNSKVRISEKLRKKPHLYYSILTLTESKYFFKKSSSNRYITQSSTNILFLK